MNTNRPIDLRQLQNELVAAGVDASRGLTHTGASLESDQRKSIFMYDASSDIIDLPTQAQVIITAHVPTGTQAETVHRTTINTVLDKTDALIDTTDVKKATIAYLRLKKDQGEF